jgi:hypothetical protein
LKYIIFYLFFLVALLAKNFRNPPRIPPAPSCGAESRIPPNFKKISLGFANPHSRKIVSQNRVHFVLVLRASLFSFGETGLLAQAPPLAERKARTLDSFSYF